MNDRKSTIFITAICVLAVAFCAMFAYTVSVGLRNGKVKTGDQNLGGLVHNTQETFDAGIAVGGTQVISSSRALTVASVYDNGEMVASSSKIGGVNATAMDGLFRTTVTVNPDSIANSATTSTNVALPGASVGDTCMATVISGDLAGTTSTVGFMPCKVLATSVATVYFKNASTTAFDAGSNVIEVKTFSF